MLEFDFSFSVKRIDGANKFLENIRAVGSVEANERVALLGPSGCGKSTFLKTLLGILKFNSNFNGSFIRLNGKTLDSKSLKEGSVGYSPQSSPLFSHLNVRDNILLSLNILEKFSNLSSDLKKQKISEALEMAQLKNIQLKWPNELSGGEKKRVSLLRSLIYSPSLLLLDEPFSDLDEDNRALFKNWLVKECSENKTSVIFVTHHSDDLDFSTRKVEWPTNSSEIRF